jgi:nucleoside-diphosphate-sugar epimerase
MKVPTVLVTGAAGFIGRRLIAALSESESRTKIIGLDRRQDIPECDRQVVCDLTQPYTLPTLQALEPIDYVVHLAAQSHVHFSLSRPDLYVQDNVLGTSNLIQALASHPSVKRFILVSSCEVYGNTHTPAKESHALRPRTPYAASKLAQETFALSAIEHQGLPTVVCRLFNNYGQGQQGNRLIPRIMQALEQDRPFELTGDGSQVRDWIAVEDTCRALIRILLSPDVSTGDIFNITTEEVCSVAQIIELCELASNKSILIRRAQKDSGHLEVSTGDASRLRAATGWRASLDLKSFIRSIVDQNGRAN